MSPLSSSRRTRLIVIVIVLGCLLVAALVDRSGSTTTNDENLVALGPRVPAATATETAWYCAAGTSNPGGQADERVFIANLDQHRARARITVMQGPDHAPQVLALNVGAGATVGVRVADILAVAEPGVLVEVAGARAVVTHLISGNGDAGVGPCARDAAPQWHFAAGTTVKGAQLWLSLFNPFADDAIVDISFITGQGPLAPGDLQGFVVPADSRVTVPVHDNARRDEIVSTEINARRGRVVAEQSQVLDGSDGRKGLTLSLGAPELARHWEFANGLVVAGRSQQLVLANPGADPTSAVIRTTLDGGVLEPETVSLPSGTSVAVDLGRRAPAGVGFSVAVEARAPIVAESFLAITAPVPSAQRGLATSIGASRAARTWVVAPTRATAPSTDSVSVVNVGTHALTFRVSATTVTSTGALSEGEATASSRIRLAPGKRVVLDLARLKVPASSTFTVRATGPVVVSREADSMPGVSVADAIPYG